MYIYILPSTSSLPPYCSSHQKARRTQKIPQCQSIPNLLLRTTSELPPSGSHRVPRASTDTHDLCGGGEESGAWCGGSGRRRGVYGWRFRGDWVCRSVDLWWNVIVAIYIMAPAQDFVSGDEPGWLCCSGVGFRLGWMDVKGVV